VILIARWSFWSAITIETNLRDLRNEVFVVKISKSCYIQSVIGKKMERIA